jgi:hypothetical protein
MSERLDLDFDGEAEDVHPPEPSRLRVPDAERFADPVDEESSESEPVPFDEQEVPRTDEP